MAHAQTRTSVAAEVSAPGKVLVVGGYLVLEAEHGGLVVATSSRFYSAVWWELPATAELEVAGVNFRAAGSAEACAQALLQRKYAELNGLIDVHSLSPPPTLPLVVHSPQFHAEMHFQLDTAAPFSVTASAGTSANPFIQQPITAAFLAAHAAAPPHHIHSTLAVAACLGATLHCALQADNDFYSQLPHLQAAGQAPSLAALAALPPCLPMLKDPSGSLRLSKTGLGSSAALTTSLAGALLQHLAVTSLPTARQQAGGVLAEAALARAVLPGAGPGALPGGLLATAHSVRLVHHVAQVAHCLAQGKVGSGFDVASASFGSMAYHRVSKGVLQRIMEQVGGASAATAVAAGSALLSPAAGWDYTAAPFALPACCDIVLGDVCGGSETPSMVRKVLAWLAAAPAHRNFWQALGGINTAVGEMLQCVSQFTGPAADSEVRKLAQLPQCDWPVPDGAAPLALSGESPHEVTATVQGWLKTKPWSSPATAGQALWWTGQVWGVARRMLRCMGVAAEVPIEPASQTRLLDATLELPGVLAVGVPGAGGYDAVYAVCLGGAEGKAAVADHWLKQQEQGAVCPLLLSAGASSLRGSDADGAAQSATKPGTKPEAGVKPWALAAGFVALALACALSTQRPA